MLEWIKKNKSDLKFFVVFLFCFGVFRSVAFAAYHIPSESMVPTLEVGDKVVVNKSAYGFSKHSVWIPGFASLPFGSDGRLFGKLPERGDVVVFKHTRQNMVMIKRVIGLPGDTISVRNGQLYVNDAPAPRTPVEQYAYREHRGNVAQVNQYDELLPNGFSHVIIEQSDRTRYDSVGPFRVPEGHLFMMGDNRDRSFDSRELSNLGFVPVSNLMGKANLILLSTYSCKKEDGLKCGARRFFSPIH